MISEDLQKKYGRILTGDACEFVTKLHEEFEPERQSVLRQRGRQQEDIDSGNLPDFRKETAEIRNGTWTVDDVPASLYDRRVEITGPAGNRKMVLNALNSGAKVFMADLEDANSPTWENQLAGQENLYDAIRRQLDFTAENGKEYVLTDNPAVLLVRPRGWHLDETSVHINGKPVSGALFDFGLYFFHNAKELLNRGAGPYFYLPKLESHLEARLWNKVFTYAQRELGLPEGTIKATVLIETIHGAFEADEILYELRKHSAGLNCGRWDYIFSYIKKLRNHDRFILPDRSLVTMTVNFMRAYTLYVVKTCHRRNAHAIGGMAAQIPVKGDPEANSAALDKVKKDKEREVLDGHDGTWVAHPALVRVAMEVFNRHMQEPNQRSRQREDVIVTAADLLAVPEGPITEEGLRANISVGLQYVEAWLRGQGAVPINHLMEDVATAEISRAQVWQWIRHPKGVLDDGRKVTNELVLKLVKEEIAKISTVPSDKAFKESRFEAAEQIFSDLVTEEQFTEFLTLKAYPYLNESEEAVK
ncbi:malate synthase A [Alteribacter lacisalsi]|uniref:Malate synthase n=1 Tax=Alteribacter lacisalsi TaxID=2045244 RepID=A0A2W0HPR4_9BACI|nr:malate synthase A [Alteribacter lacisalsi]PYZ99102.1 malate synthase A [Alteribacter lacisalsi]